MQQVTAQSFSEKNRPGTCQKNTKKNLRPALLLVILKEDRLSTLVKTESWLFRSSDRRCSIAKVVVIKFEKFTGKHLCQVVLNKVASLSSKFLAEFYRFSGKLYAFFTFFRNNFFKEHLNTIASEFFETSRLLKRTQESCKHPRRRILHHTPSSLFSG